MPVYVRSIMLAILSALPMIGIAGPVNINTADAETLAAELKGVGLSRAQAIVEYRDKQGPFSQPEDLLQVSGVGHRILKMNEGNIRTSAAADSGD